MKSRKLFKFQKVGKGFPNSSLDKEPTCSAEDPSLIPRSGRYPEEGIGNPLQYSWASLVAQLVKNLPAMQRPGEDVGKIPQRREKLPTPVLWPGEFHGLYTPWGCKEAESLDYNLLFKIEFAHIHSFSF